MFSTISFSQRSGIEKRGSGSNGVVPISDNHQEAGGIMCLCRTKKNGIMI